MNRYPTDRQALERDCDLEFIIAGGPGGQHRNKVESGVRLRHRPTGLVVSATERRSQSANRDMAFRRMAEKLLLKQRRRKTRRPTLPTAASRIRRLEQKKMRSELKGRRSTIPAVD